MIREMSSGKYIYCLNNYIYNNRTGYILAYIYGYIPMIHTVNCLVTIEHVSILTHAMFLGKSPRVLQ